MSDLYNQQKSIYYYKYLKYKKKYVALTKKGGSNSFFWDPKDEKISYDDDSYMDDSHMVI